VQLTLANKGYRLGNNYWNKPSTTQQPSGWTVSADPNMSHQFPPTHGVTKPSPVVSKDPGLISILDLTYLAQHTSFTGSSRILLPRSRFLMEQFSVLSPQWFSSIHARVVRADVQFVWDLMRLQYSKSFVFIAAEMTQTLVLVT